MSAAVVDGERVPGDVEVVDGGIAAVGLAPSGRGGTALPGFVDWQVNGFGGVHLAAAEDAGFEAAEAALGAAGIVFAAPTFFSRTVEGYREALGRLARWRARNRDGCLLGAHLEGPFLSPVWAGAHDPSTFLDGGASVVDELLAAGPVAMMTVAPEIPGGAEVARALRSAGVAVSVGHSDATAAQCVASGAQAITHCWNAHRRFTPRDPGPAGWALAESSVTVGLIADGVHVSSETIALTMAAARGRVAVTTDAIAPAGTAATSWDASVSGAAGPVVIEGGAARLADGTLAGSVTTPSAMLAVLLDAGVTLPDAAHALSAPQAAVLGLGRWSLRPGDPAHVTVVDDSMEVTAAFRAGESLL